MSRKYVTSPTMLHDKLSDKVVQPDLRLVKTLHRMLDLIPDDNIAIAIDVVVAELIRFHNPHDIRMSSSINPEIILNYDPNTKRKE